MDGILLLKEIKSAYPSTPVILITSFASIESAVEAIKQGAYDYITKPIVDSEIKIVIERLIKQRQLQEENIKLKEQLSATQRERFHNIVGRDEKMQKIYNLIEAVSTTRATVLIRGESGTGKRLIAHAIHKYNEQERGKPFVEVSCGALTETLLESELFGHVKGAFTGAIKDKMGRFELADGGTIFLDEIDAFSPTLQVKLLRVLQEGEFERVGDTKTIKVDVRVISATNQNLEDLITQGKFRKDLYYRLNIISIEIPPLRERKGDIPLLIEDFISKHTKHTSRKIEKVSDETIAILMNYSWPGNIRELENVIERAVILSKGPVINPEDLPASLISNYPQGAVVHTNNLKLKDALKDPEKDLILRSLKSVNWNRNETAKVLGINRTTLYKKMLKYGLFKQNKSIRDRPNN
jgi:DNA-binding NtrC family response regulator